MQSQPTPASPTLSQQFELFAERISRFTGSTLAFMLAAVTVIGWAIAGPFLAYSNNWQMVINTATTIITFLMVFLIQKAQNKESVAVQLKLNELIAANRKASNRLVSVENLAEDELLTLKNHYLTMAQVSKESENIMRSHSVEEAISDSLKKLNDQEPE